MTKEKFCNRCNNPKPDFYPSNQYTCKDCLKKMAKENYSKVERVTKRKQCRICDTEENLAKAGKYPSGQPRYENICVSCKYKATKEYKALYNKKNKETINKKARIRRVLNIKPNEVKRGKDVVHRWLLETKKQQKTYDQFMLWLSESEFSHLEFEYEVFFARAGFDGSRYIMFGRFE